MKSTNAYWVSMTAPFYGREYELGVLRRLLSKRSASLAVVRGRRRIGKSRLIAEFAKGHHILNFSGIPPNESLNRQGQINEFAKQMQRLLAIPLVQADNWGDLFWHLGQQVRFGRVIVVFDEISWMGPKDPSFLGQLKNAWDLHFSKNSELILILCGSVSNWIEQNIISSTGFFGRISIDLQLGPLPLKDCAAFWEHELDRISPYEILKVLTVTGGVPQYLESIQTHLSAEENIKRLCFQSNGLLYREFDLIFSDLFDKKSKSYKRIVEALAGPPLTLEELSQSLGSAKGSPLLNRLKELVLSGFVSEDTTWNLKSNKNSKFKKYRLSDNYLRFYLRAIQPLKEQIEQSMFKWRRITLMKEWSTWLGLQFENLVLQNFRPLLSELNLDFSEVVRLGSYFQRANDRQKGCQIDLLVQTTSCVLYLCEIKFSSNPIKTDVLQAIHEKVKRLSKPHGYSIRTVLIHVNGVAPKVRTSRKIDQIIDYTQLLIHSSGLG